MVLPLLFLADDFFFILLLRPTTITATALAAATIQWPVLLHIAEAFSERFFFGCHSIFLSVALVYEIQFTHDSLIGNFNIVLA